MSTSFTTFYDNVILLGNFDEADETDQSFVVHQHSFMESTPDRISSEEEIVSTRMFNIYSISSYNQVTILIVMHACIFI